MKKIIAIAAAAVLLLSTAACSGSQGKEYPVKLASYTFSSKPTSVVCLSDSVADILIACGYADAITARTDECTQEEISDVPTVGSKFDPSVKKIKSVSPDVVFTDTSVSSTISEKLAEQDVTVLNMMTAQSGDDLKTLYQSLGAVMDGNETGRANGEKKAGYLLDTMSELQRVTPERDVIPTACYLYDEYGTAATTKTFSGKLFAYANAENICTDKTTAQDMLETIKLNNPKYIFCAKGVKDKLMQSDDLQALDAVKSGRIYEIDANIFDRQGNTVTDVLSYIIETIYPEIKDPEASQAGNEESKQEDSKPEESSGQESKNEEVSKPESSQVKADTSLKITEDTVFGQGDENDDIKKIQQRLKNLGYGEFKDGITNYFGEQTAAAFRAFEKNNALDEDGFASVEDLTLLFSADVKPAKEAQQSSN